MKKKKINKPDRKDAEEAVKTLLSFVGEDVSRPGLLDTPKRVVNCLLYTSPSPRDSV